MLFKLKIALMWVAALHIVGCYKDRDINLQAIAKGEISVFPAEHVLAAAYAHLCGIHNASDGSSVHLIHEYGWSSGHIYGVVSNLNYDCINGRTATCQQKERATVEYCVDLLKVRNEHYVAMGRTSSPGGHSIYVLLDVVIEGEKAVVFR